MNQRLNLVTGATGFCASHLIKLLLQDGQRVVGTDLPAALEDEKRRDLGRQLGLDWNHPLLELVPAELLDRASLVPLLARPVAKLFHTASLYDYSAPLERLRRINVEGTGNLLDVLIAKPAAERPLFIHYSTCGVFGKPYPASAGRERNNLPFSEDSPSPKNSPKGATEPAGTHLVNAYSVSKWEQEQMVWDAHRSHELPIIVLRPAPVYGPGSDYGNGGIVLGIARGYLPVFPKDGRNFITDTVHVEDVVRFTSFISDQKYAVGEDYNIVDNSVISYSEFGHYVALLTGRRMYDLPIVPMSLVRALAMPLSRLFTWLEHEYGVPRWRVFEVQSTTYLASSYWISNRKSLATGFQYRYPDVREGLKDTVAWMRKAGWL